MQPRLPNPYGYYFLMLLDYIRATFVFVYRNIPKLFLMELPCYYDCSESLKDREGNPEKHVGH